MPCVSNAAEKLGVDMQADRVDYDLASYDRWAGKLTNKEMMFRTRGEMASRTQGLYAIDVSKFD